MFRLLLLPDQANPLHVVLQFSLSAINPGMFGLWQGHSPRSPSPAAPLIEEIICLCQAANSCPPEQKASRAVTDHSLRRHLCHNTD